MRLFFVTEKYIHFLSPITNQDLLSTHALFRDAEYFEHPQLEPQNRPALAHLQLLQLPFLHEHFTWPAPPTNEFVRANSRKVSCLVSWPAS